MHPGRLVALLILCCVSTTAAWAQHYAEVFGQILDSSQAGITDAVITAVDQDTGFRRQVMSETGGMYAVGSLAPGSYKVTVRKEGFGAVVQFGVKLTGSAPTRLDFRLSVSNFSDSITVVGTTPALDQQDASTGGQFDFDAVADLPLNGRGILTLLELIPGTSVVPATRGDAGQFSTNGMRANTNYFTVDGVSANVGVSAGGLPAQSTGGALPALSAFGSLDSIISIEAMQEFQLQTSTTVAEFGRMPGANIAVSSRGGSEQFHGATSFAVRNYHLTADDWFLDRQGVGRPPLDYKDFSQSAGGPIKRNHTFFFLSFEQIALNEPYVWEQPVPSVATRTSLLTTVQPLVNLFPLPNGAALGATGNSDWLGETNRPAGLTSGSGRIDQAITPRVTLFGRYADSPSHNQFGTPEVNHLDLRSQSLTLGLNARPTARSVLDFRVNESQSTANSVWTDGTNSDTPSCALQPLVSAEFKNQPVPCDFLVRFTINGVGQVVSGSEGERRQRQFQLVQTAALERAHHSLKFGLDYRQMRSIRRDPTGSLGITANSITDLNNPQDWWVAELAVGDNDSVAVHELSLWAQDTWQVGSRLTVAGGVRWEFSPPPPLATPQNFLDFSTGGLAADPNRSLWPLTYGNFAPRLGLAYRLDKSGRTVLRAGAGLYYDSSVSIATAVINAGPLNGATLTTSGNSGLGGNITYGFVPNLQLPQVIQWNVALEHGFGSHDVVALSYVGTSGNHLLQTEMSDTLNLHDYAVLTTNRAGSDYDALQFQYRRHVASGLDATASYVWSHSLDNDSSDAFLSWSGEGASGPGDHASSDFDVRQALTTAFRYRLPGRGDRSARGLLGGWVIDGILHARTGFPITVLDAEDTTGLGLANAFRPDWVYGQPLWMADSSAPGGRVLNPAAFVAVPAPLGLVGAQGTLGRNVPTGFGMWQLDLGLAREFHISDRYGFQLRFDGFNALNHPNFGDPIKFLDSPLFGRSTSLLNMELGTGSPGSGLAPALQTGGPRAVQVSIRFHF
jgi:Carboxypeptidase regulatory-like domain